MNTHDVLRTLVKKVQCKPNWSFRIINEEGFLSLVITVEGPDSYNEDHSMLVSHWYPVPEATYNEKSWLRWIFERCRGIENHELGEWFKIDGRRPFAPLHGPGEDPYVVHEYRDKTDAQTLQGGAIEDSIKV
jgi:hypothetical protein